MNLQEIKRMAKARLKLAQKEYDAIMVHCTAIEAALSGNFKQRRRPTKCRVGKPFPADYPKNRKQLEELVAQAREERDRIDWKTNKKGYDKLTYKIGYINKLISRLES